MFPNLRTSENFHIVLWLLKDLCWVMDLHVAGVVMVVPTVAMAVHITWQCRDDIGELLHSLSVVLWIVANSIWMLGEFFLSDSTRPLAAAFFVAGLLTVSWYYVVVLPRRLHAKRQDSKDTLHSLPTSAASLMERKVKRRLNSRHP